MKMILAGQRLWIGCVAMLLLLQSALVAQEVAIDDKTLETFREGQEFIQSGEFAEASKRFKECVKAYEDFGDGWFMLAYATHMEGKIPQALKLHRKAAEFEGNFQPIAVYNIACAHALLGQPAEALQALQKSVKMGNEDLDQIRNDTDLFILHTTTDFAKLLAELNADDELVEQLDKGQDLINGQEFDQAAEVYAAILKDDPDNDFATYRLGYALHGAGKLDEAIEYHKKATEFPATKGIASYNWGCALSLKGDKEAAIEKLSESIDSGFVRPDAFQNDPDLDNLREEDSFKELVAKVEKIAEDRARALAKAEEASDESDESEKSEDSAAEESEAEESESEESADAEPMPEMPPFSLGMRMQLTDDGVVVDGFVEDSAAERDGIEIGDQLIKANGEELTDDPLAVLFPLLSRDDKISFEVIRDGETKTIEVKPNKR